MISVAGITKKTIMLQFTQFGFNKIISDHKEASYVTIYWV